ncbi:uncharacterized protein COLE_00911 [Cutaneotrichosporon oleaginosum]|uniref:uncharacterized protein n=1 Tax=Cutaneotrichosporon oleaginosum TaxID=879819 RepID=UPI00132B5A62|nr:hypothetical protein COLE_00911 [Cutaneotrichosporon oleaginosum]
MAGSALKGGCGQAITTRPAVTICLCSPQLNPPCQPVRPPLQQRHCLHLACSDIIKIILAIILPPLGVFLERGCGADLLINILLTCLGYIPGIIHALYIILK